MARYKEYSYEQTKLIPIAFSQQILPGTFEYTLNYLIDNEFDLSPFEQRYHNDETGAPAYDPAILLKIVLYAYARGIVSSREIEQSCRENIIFMALSADTHPHFTTIADFISSSSCPAFRAESITFAVSGSMPSVRPKGSVISRAFVSDAIKSRHASGELFCG